MFDAGFWDGIGWTALTSVVTSSLVVGVLQVVIKSRLDGRLARQLVDANAKNAVALERQRAELVVQNERELQRIRGEAMREVERFKQRFTLLATRQVEAVEVIYKNLADTHSALLQLVSPGRFGGEPSDEELWLNVHNARWRGKEHLRTTRLYLPHDLGSEIDKIYDRIGSSEMKYRYTVKGTEHRPHDWDRQGDLWDEANGEIATVLRDLEIKFRQLIVGDLGLPALTAVSVEDLG